MYRYIVICRHVLYIMYMLYICIHIYIFHLGMGSCIPLIPLEEEYSRGLGKEGGTSVTCNHSCLMIFCWRKSTYSIFSSAHNFRTFFAYPFSSSCYLSAYPSLLYVRFYRAIWQPSFVFYWMFSWYIWSDTDEQPRWDFGVY